MMQTAREQACRGGVPGGPAGGKWHWDWHSAAVGISPDRGGDVDGITDESKIINHGDVF